MARTLDQILAELSPQFDPQIEQIRKRQAEIPGQLQAEEQGLEAKQQSAFGSITDAARRRGLGSSGIPLAEQARYSATEYMPALARLRQSGREQAMGLEDAILGIQERRGTLAQQIRGQEEQRDWETQQNELNRRNQLAAARFTPTVGNQNKAAAGPAFQRKMDGGFAFTDAAGKPISAATYASQTGQDVRDVLYEMGQGGDQYAAQLYNQFRSDPFFGKGNAAYDKKVMQQYSPIFWGAV